MRRPPGDADFRCSSGCRRSGGLYGVPGGLPTFGNDGRAGPRSTGSATPFESGSRRRLGSAGGPASGPRSEHRTHGRIRSRSGAPSVIPLGSGASRAWTPGHIGGGFERAGGDRRSGEGVSLVRARQANASASQAPALRRGPKEPRRGSGRRTAGRSRCARRRRAASRRMGRACRVRERRSPAPTVAGSPAVEGTRVLSRNGLTSLPAATGRVGLREACSRNAWRPADLNRPARQFAALPPSPRPARSRDGNL